MNLASNNTTLGVKMRTNICQTNIGTGGVLVLYYSIRKNKKYAGHVAITHIDNANSAVIG